MLFKAVAANTDGRFSLMERTLPAGGRMPPAHAHDNNDEAYFVLDGDVTFIIDGRDLSAGPGVFILVPRSVEHTFGNVSMAASRLLVLHAPALDRYFADLHELWARARPPTSEEELAVMRRHGMVPAGKESRTAEP
jgi:mannose-6-phosphate isomerase-like protein (cupin superfamily)